MREEQVDTLEFLLREGISDLSRCNIFNDPLRTARDMEYSEAVQLLTAWKKRHSTVAVSQPDQQNTQAIESVAKPVSSAQWHVVDDTTIMRVRHQGEAGYRLTDIFNFAMGNCISLQRNLETDHETAVTSDLSAPACAVAAEQAYEQLVKRGGNPPPLAKPIVKKAIGE